MIGFVFIIGWFLVLLAAVGSLLSMAAALVSQLLTVGLILLVGAVFLMAIRDRQEED